jgi:hypothetical protein
LENEGDFKNALISERGAPIYDPFSILTMENAVIAELAFNKSKGMWSFHCLRTKTKPNFITVAFQTLEQIMEAPISVEELIKLARKKE